LRTFFDEAEYIPVSKFDKKYEPYNFQFEVTEMRIAGSSVVNTRFAERRAPPLDTAFRERRHSSR
jgi:hypothetical protein